MFCPHESQCAKYICISPVQCPPGSLDLPLCNDHLYGLSIGNHWERQSSNCLLDIHDYYQAESSCTLTPPCHHWHFQPENLQVIYVGRNQYLASIVQSNKSRKIGKCWCDTITRGSDKSTLVFDLNSQLQPQVRSMWI